MKMNSRSKLRHNLRSLSEIDATGFLPEDLKRFSDRKKSKGKQESSELEKSDFEVPMADYNRQLYDLLYLMFAEGRRSLLVILQGIDTSGKDGSIRHFFANSNPQGVRVHSFKKPTEEELRHHFLWRCQRVVPEAGTTVIFNRSYYEEVTTVKVHPKLLKNQFLPEDVQNDPNIFHKRYEQINQFEKLLTENGTIVIKLLLHISKDEQRERIQVRLNDRTKNWKFSEADVKERGFWSQHLKAFDEMIQHTNTTHAPWHILPADKKWYRNYLISKIIVSELKKYRMKFPKVNKAKLPKINS